MPDYRATFFFESHQNADLGVGSSLGWTESWYKTSGTTEIETVLNDPDLDRYVTKRLACLPNIYRMSFIRVGDEAVPRRFKIRNINGGAGFIIPSTSLPAQVQCAVLVDLEKLPLTDNLTEKVHHRRFLMRGLPVAIINGNVLDDNNGLFDLFRTFFNFIGNKPAGGIHPAGLERFSWGLKYQDPSVAPTGIRDMGANVDDSRNINVLPRTALAPVAGQHYQISGVPRPLEEYNRIWKFIRVQTIGPDDYMILGTSRSDLGGDIPRVGAATIRLAKYKYGPADQYVIIGLRNKRTGRVFRQLRGRSVRR